MTDTNPIPTQPETLLPCPMDHPIVNGVRFTDFSNEYKQHIWCYDCGLEFEGRVDETAESVAQRWNTRRAAVTAPRGDMLNTLKLIATTLHEQIHNYRPVGDCLAFPCNKANAAIHAAGTTDNSQTGHQVSDQRVKLLLRYADHLRGCASYTNGPCTCGFESAMQELADRGTAANSSPTPAAPSVVDAIAELIKMRDEYADDERVTRPVNTLNAAIERLAFANSNAAPAERTRVEEEQEKS